MDKKEFPRSFRIDIDPSNYKIFDGLAIDFNNQRVLGLKNGSTFPLVGKTSLQYHRKRKKGGEKVLHRSSGVGNRAWFNTNRQLLDYQHLISVDTNTNYINGSSVSITAAFHVIPHYHDAVSAMCYSNVLALIEMWNVIGKPENIGWWQILQAIDNSPERFLGKIGLVVDSDLGRHEEYNTRHEPIIEDYYLPDNVSLIYASDQGGGEHLSTKMIKYSHNLADDLYRNESLALNPNGLNEGVKGLYSHIRQWDTESMALRPFF